VTSTSQTQAGVGRSSEVLVINTRNQIALKGASNISTRIVTSRAKRFSKD